MDVDEKIRRQINAKVRELYLISGGVSLINYTITISEEYEANEKKLYQKMSFNLEISASGTSEDKTNVVIRFGGDKIIIAFVEKWYIKLSELMFKLYKLDKKMGAKIYLDKFVEVGE
ncbi:MAG: hypothetical protein V3V19_11230 [Cocleimonas sp.]